MSSSPFSLEGERKGLFFIVSPFCNQCHKIHPIPQVFTGSFAVDVRVHLRSRIICGPFWGSFAVSGSFAVLYITPKLFPLGPRSHECDDKQTKN